MDVLAERTWQALGIGDLKPSSLEAHNKMLEQAQEYADRLKQVQRSCRNWQYYTSEFLGSIGGFLKETTQPLQWRQEDLTQPAVSAPAPVVVAHGQLFDKSTHMKLAETVPVVLKRVVDADLNHPIELWLTAYESAKERMGPLESLRLRYDAVRRRLSAEAAHRAAEAAAHSSGRLTHKGAAVCIDPLEEVAGKADYGVLHEFEEEAEAVWEHLVWLTNAEARLKAYLAHVLQYIHDSAVAFEVPPNLLEVFPTHVLRGKVAAAGGEGKEQEQQGQVGGKEAGGAPSTEPQDMQAARDQDRVRGPEAKEQKEEGADVVEGGSGEGAYRLMGKPSLGPTDYLLVGGAADEHGKVPSANKAPSQMSRTSLDVIKRDARATIITTHGPGAVFVEPAPVPADVAEEGQETTAQGATQTAEAPPTEGAPEAPPFEQDGQPLNIDAAYEQHALEVAAAKVAALNLQEQQQGQHEKQAQESLQQEGEEGAGRGGRVEEGVTAVPHAAERGSGGEPARQGVAEPAGSEGEAEEAVDYGLEGDMTGVHKDKGGAKGGAKEGGREEEKEGGGMLLGALGAIKQAIAEVTGGAKEST